MTFTNIKLFHLLEPLSSQFLLSCSRKGGTERKEAPAWSAPTMQALECYRAECKLDHAAGTKGEEGRVERLNNQTLLFQ